MTENMFKLLKCGELCYMLLLSGGHLGYYFNMERNSLRSICAFLPKVELHAHLNGSLTDETFRELRALAVKNGHNTTRDDTLWLEYENKNVENLLSWSLSECFQLFDLAHSLTRTIDAIKLSTLKVIEDFHRDNVIYLELRSTLREEEFMTKEQYLETMVNCVLQAQNTMSIVVKLIVSINRSYSVEEAKQNVTLALKFHKLYPELIVGIDLSGDPCKGRFCDFLEVLQEARNEKLKVTIHCAEVPNKEEIGEILKFEPDRIGHGTCVHPNCGGSEELWKALLDSEIPVEICPTSNVKCKTVASYEQHHFKYLWERNHPFMICTDDKGIFDTTLTEEFYQIAKHHNLTSRDLVQIVVSAVKFSFTEEKCNLMHIVNKFRNDVENMWPVVKEF